MEVKYAELDLSISALHIGAAAESSGEELTDPSDGGFAVAVVLRFNDPTDAAGHKSASGKAKINVTELLPLEREFEAYGQLLAKQLFADVSVAAEYASARAVAESSNLDLRIRLSIEPSAQNALVRVRWELLTDPRTKECIATSGRILFSRLAQSDNSRRVKLRPKAALKALVAVSAPIDLKESSGPKPVDAKGEIERAKRSLGTIDLAVLEGAVTKTNLVNGLLSGIDILYLACHGAISKEGAQLWLMDDAGNTAITLAEDLARSLRDHTEDLPRLVVLASCESVNNLTANVAAFGPMLAAVGVPAVLAMQGKISMESVEKMMPTFFTELLIDGQIDRALAVARRFAQPHDSWMPALFLRLKEGKIWYQPGFPEGFAKWPTIASNVRDGEFVALIGPDLGETIIGSASDRAEALAKHEDLPLESAQRRDPAAVYQYLSVTQAADYARKQVEIGMRREVERRHLRPEEIADSRTKALSNLLKEQLNKRRAEGKFSPHDVLARQPGTLYISASLDPLMLLALEAAGKAPQPLLCVWKPTDELDKDGKPTGNTTEPRAATAPAAPTKDQPVVYQMLGRLSAPTMMVLNEDDHVDYLMASVKHRLVPLVVQSALTDWSLLFVGFRLTDWSFRVLYRLLMSTRTPKQDVKKASVGVQVDPNEHGFANLKAAQKYLEAYYQPAAIDIFWGSSEDFLRDLEEQLKRLPPRPATPPPERDGY